MGHHILLLCGSICIYDSHCDRLLQNLYGYSKNLKRLDQQKEYEDHQECLDSDWLCPYRLDVYRSLPGCRNLYTGFLRLCGYSLRSRTNDMLPWTDHFVFHHSGHV